MRGLTVFSLVAALFISAASTSAYAVDASGGDPSGGVPSGGVPSVSTSPDRVAQAGAPRGDAPQATVPGYPDHQIRMIVPFAVGGSADMYSRVIAQKLGEALKVSVVVDNRAGAGGVIGTQLAAESPPDGYTLLVGNIGTIGINPALYKSLPYDPKSLVPVTEIASAPFVVVVVPTFPAKNVSQLVAMAKEKPGYLNFASTGNGSPGHLTGALLESRADIKLTHVPYKSISAILSDLISGRIQLYFLGIAPAKTQIAAGKLIPMATTGAKRSSLMPDVPTVAEAGIPGFEVSGWYGIFLPRGASPTLVAQLNRELVKIVNQPDVKARFAADGAELVGNTPEQFSAYIDEEIKKWGDVVKASGAKID